MSKRILFQCATCDEDFTTLRAFDRHRRGVTGNKNCLDPEEVGLELDKNGRWKFPANGNVPWRATSETA